MRVQDVTAVVAWLRAVRSSRCTWPYARWVVHILPWHWRLVPFATGHLERGTRDEPDPRDNVTGSASATLAWLWLELDVQSNWPPFGVMDEYRAARR